MSLGENLMAFKIGDTVRLKSGGPLMTVASIGTAGGHPNVDCIWFEGTRRNEAGFPPDALELAQKPAASVRVGR